MSEIVIEVGDRHIKEINEELQEACKTGKPAPEISAVLLQVCAQLDPLVAGLAVVEGAGAGPEPVSDVPAPDPGQLTPMLARLAELLEDCDAEAAEAVAELRPLLLASPQSGDVRKLERLVDAYEFDEALAVVQAWMEAVS